MAQPCQAREGTPPSGAGCCSRQVPACSGPKQTQHRVRGGAALGLSPSTRSWQAGPISGRPSIAAGGQGRTARGWAPGPLGVPCAAPVLTPEVPEGHLALIRGPEKDAGPRAGEAPALSRSAPLSAAARGPAAPLLWGPGLWVLGTLPRGDGPPASPALRARLHGASRRSRPRPVCGLLRQRGHGSLDEGF